MNIKRAKEEIEHTVKAYLAKDALGEYAIPAIRQRPILLMGPPGIGKTQVMEQVARECGVALVAYTITHHTRQSAVGLPFIRQRHYGDKDVSVTEYTMSCPSYTSDAADDMQCVDLGGRRNTKKKKNRTNPNHVNNSQPVKPRSSMLRPSSQ